MTSNNSDGIADNASSSHPSNSTMQSSSTTVHQKPKSKLDSSSSHSTWKIPNDAHEESPFFLPRDKLQEKDYFSGSFFVSRQTFLAELKPRHYTKLESASLETVSRKPKKAKMFLDWTALSVEHFSHWWKTILGILEHVHSPDDGNSNGTTTVDPDLFFSERERLVDRMVGIFLRYIQEQAPKHRVHNRQDKRNKWNDLVLHPMHPTIGAIAFQPYRLPFHRPTADQSLTQEQQQQQQWQEARQETKEQMEEILTTYSLAATISSMAAAGFGRILVVGYQRPLEEVPAVQEAFKLVQRYFADGTIQFDHRPPKYHISSTDTTTLAYVAIADETWVRNYRKKKLFNLQRGVVIGLQKAFQGYSSTTKQQQEEWLGKRRNTDHNVDYWKYIYLTEPDIILHTKPWVLPLLAQGMDDNGLNFFPHRLQPLPHQSDFDKIEYYNLAVDFGVAVKTASLSYSHLLPKNRPPFDMITTINDRSSCCDEVTNEYPGRSKEFGWRQHQVPCEDWWWTCGFVHNRRKVPKDSIENNIDSANNNSNSSSHLRLAKYQMMRLASGSGVVFGSTEQGRRCLPQARPCSMEAGT